MFNNLKSATAIQDRKNQAGNKMAEIQDNTKSGFAELEEIFQEYKNKLELAKQESEDLFSDAWQKSEHIIADKQEKAQKIANEIERSARVEADQIILEAKNVAEKIIEEADDRTKREAKDKTRREIEKIIADARQAAEKQSTEIMAHSKEEAEQIVKEARESVRAEALKEAEGIVLKAQEDADKIRENSITNATEIDELVMEVLQKADSIFNAFKKQVQDELSEVIQAIDKAKDNLEIRSAIDKVDIVEKKDDKNILYSGRRELNILTPYDSLQIKRLKEFLEQIPNLKLDGEAATEDDYSIYINIVEPLPLMTLLLEMSLIASYDIERDKIKLRLNPRRNGN